MRTISINLANKILRLNIEDNEEEIVREAASAINQKIIAKRKKLPPQVQTSDLHYMVMMEFAKLACEQSKKSSSNQDIEQQVTDLEELLNATLS